ncbi:MAG TPA: DNA-formamidopyrimidine glycosylase family protein, partial [Egibacteraceae bacterium]|nr:DNA-formamidopyrimidine glycosylase family protein [Egibacteraceae bacterium]
MSQLPEVEVIRKDLEREIVGKRFKDITVKNASMVARHRNRPEFVKALQGRKIDGIMRRGTWLLMHLDDGAALAIRLGPQGTLTRETATEEAGRHTQLVATFTTGGSLHYVDPAKSGEVFVAEPGQINSLSELTPPGIDPLADTFTWQVFSDQLRERDTSLKQALCDETFLIGL